MCYQENPSLQTGTYGAPPSRRTLAGVTSATTVSHMLTSVTADPGRPRLTWYGPDGERIELSGHVLDNWVTKSTNLLVAEFDAGPGTSVVLDLPPHWRAVVWALATWRVGATLSTARGTTAEPGSVVLTDRPGAWAADPAARALDLVAVARPALARRFDGELPAGATDAASAVMTYGDSLGPVPPTDGATTALDDGTRTVAHADLLAWARAETTARHPEGPWAEVASGAARRLLVEPAPDDLEGVLAVTLCALAADGSVVLVAPDVARELATDPARRERLVRGERVD
jgi:uncharacterized protein (TIGR03089 family)